MSDSRNPRIYIALVFLLISATVILLREHGPSFLRPNLHMYAYVSTSDGSLTVIDLVGLRVVAHIPVASNISDLREHASRDEIWGVSSADGCVWVLDAPSRQITRIPVGPLPYSFDFSPSGNRIYTTSSANDQLIAVDPASRTVLGRAKTGSEPIAVRAAPDNSKVLVLNRRSSTLSIHDAPTLQQLASVPVIPQPDQVAILPDSSLAFVTSRSQNRLSVVDLNRALLLTNLELAGKPTDMLFKPDGGELYVVAPESHGLQIIDTWTHEVGDYMVLGSAPATAIATPDASEMYVADRAAGRIMPVDILNRRIGRPISVGASPSAMRFSPTDPGEQPSMLLVVDEDSADLAILRTRTDSLITMLPVGSRPQHLAVKIF
jgi:YVTN family beta-propeller protein